MRIRNIRRNVANSYHTLLVSPRERWVPHSVTGHGADNDRVLSPMTTPPSVTCHRGMNDENAHPNSEDEDTHGSNGIGDHSKYGGGLGMLAAAAQMPH